MFASTKAFRPPAKISIIIRGRDSLCINRQSASSSLVNTASIIRSCNKAMSGCHCSIDSDVLVSTKKAMPRSTLATVSRPLLCTISVALLDQGEIVPGRGVTKKKVSSSPGSTCITCASNSVVNKSCSDEVNSCSSLDSTK